VPRPAKFDQARILGATATLVATGGPGAATIGAISSALGAPSGSIYHRFGSRDELLGRLWLTKAAFFQDRWASALDATDPVEAGLAAALSLPRAVRDDFEGACIMLLHRRDDFLSSKWPAEMTREAERLGAHAKAGLTTVARRLFGRTSSAARLTASFAVLDVPFAAVHRFVAMGKMPPPEVDELIATAYRAVVHVRRL
jgi:AcrR family transcriptional regulator